MVDVFRVGIQQGWGAVGDGGAGEGHFLESQDLLVESLLGVLPGKGGELVGAAELPEGAIIDILLLTAGLKGLREGGGTAENGDAWTLARVVQREPADATDGIRQPVPQLRDVRVGAPGHGDGPAEFDRPGGDGVEGVPHGGRQPGVGDRAHHGVSRVRLVGRPRQLDALGHVEVRAFVSLPVERHHLADVDRLLGLDGERQFVHVVGEPERGSEVIEDEVLPVVEVLPLRIIRIEILPKDELALAVPETVVDGNPLHVGRGHHVAALAVNPADAGDIGRYGDMVVGNSLGHPSRADPVLPHPHDLELPDLVLVGHGQAFAAVAIAVLLGKGAHQPDGVAGIVAPLERDPFQLLDGEPASGVHQGIRPAESGFADGQLLLIEAGIGRVEIGIGMGRLGNLPHQPHPRGVPAELGLHRPPEHGMHFPGLMVRGGLHLHPGAIAPVTRMRSDHGPIRGGFPPHHDGRTALTHKLLLLGKVLGEEGAQDGP